MIEGLCGLALLCALFCLSIWRTIKRAQEDVARAAADKANAEHATRVEHFLDELSTDAAYASVGDFAYVGADLLSMLERHDLITGQEIEDLIAEARRRLPDDEPEPFIALGNGHDAGRPTDDEIPF